MIPVIAACPGCLAEVATRRIATTKISTGAVAAESVEFELTAQWRKSLDLTMTLLGLSTVKGQRPVPAQLPASAFPDRADVYVCDNCGRNITKHLHPGRAHCSGQAMGPQRYVCRCAQKWLTGAAEWDHFDPRIMRWRVEEIVGLSVLFSVGSLIVSIPVYFALRDIGIGKAALIVAVAITALPSALIVASFSIQLLASSWRTRFRWKRPGIAAIALMRISEWDLCPCKASGACRE